MVSSLLWIPIFVLVWGVFLFCVFDRLAIVIDALAERGPLARQASLAGVVALLGGALVGHLRARFAFELGQALPQALIGTPGWTFLCSTAALWLAGFQLLRWRGLRAREAALDAGQEPS